MTKLQRKYRDRRGRMVTVVEWDAEKQQVIYLQVGYEHRLMQPLELFRKKFTRVL